LLVATAKASPQPQIQPIGPHNTDGLIVFANSLSDQQIEVLSRANFLLVMIYRIPRNNLNLPFVAVENTAATFELIQHLITVHQRRQILFLRGPREQDNSILPTEIVVRRSCGCDYCEPEVSVQTAEMVYYSTPVIS
jgi:DNA-binding LacI/PurR family transcriptional regulator